MSSSDLLSVAGEIASRLVNELKSQHDVFRSVFYALLASGIVMLVVGIVSNHIEVAIHIGATIVVLSLFQLFGYDSTESVILMNLDNPEQTPTRNDIDRIASELCNGLTFMQHEVECRKDGNVISNPEIKQAWIRCKCKPHFYRTNTKDDKNTPIAHVRCECKYRRIIKLYSYVDVNRLKGYTTYLLTITLTSSPLRIFLARARGELCRLILWLCKKMCSAGREDIELISFWFEIREDLFLVLQNTLIRFEKCCKIRTIHTV